MRESKTIKSFIPEMRCEGADIPESVTSRLQEGAILVNPFGVPEYEGAFYYQDYQSYLDDEPYIKQFMKYQYKKPKTYGQHFWIEYDDDNPDHRSAREKSFLITLVFDTSGQGFTAMKLANVAPTFKEAMPKRNLDNGLILPLKVLELELENSGIVGLRALKRDIKKNIEKHIKRRR